jgi:hypothetical protein
VEVDHDDDVAIRSEEFGVPAVAPIVSPRPFGATMDKELHGILFAGIEVGRLHEEAFDLVAVSTGEPERFKRGHGDGGENGSIDTRNGISVPFIDIAMGLIDFYLASFIRAAKCID